MNDVLKYYKSFRFSAYHLHDYLYSRRSKIRISYNRNDTSLHYNNTKLSKLKTKSIISLLDHLKTINCENEDLIYILETELLFRRIKKEIESIKIPE